MSTCIGTPIDTVGPSLNYDPVRGESLIQPFEGTLEACLAKAIDLRNIRPDLAFVLEPADGPAWRIVVRSPDFTDGDAQATVQWELLGNEIHKDLYEHPRSLQIGEANLRTIRNAIADPQPDTAPTLAGDALTLYTLLLKGTNAFLTSQYVLRRTQIVSSRYQVRVAFNQIDYVWTTAQIVNVEAPPAALLFSIIEIPIPASQAGYQWGWLKKSPTVQQASGNRFQITQEWWLEQWSTYVYGTAS